MMPVGIDFVSRPLLRASFRCAIIISVMLLVLTGVAVAENADLELTMRVSDSTPNIGATIIYTIKVLNNGPNRADAAIVCDTLPAGITIVSAPPNNYNGTTRVWTDTIGALAKNADSTRILTVTVNAGTGGSTITDNAWIIASNPADPISTNNYRSMSLTVNQPPVAVCRDTTVNAGSNCLATASIDNGSNDPDAGDIITLLQTPSGPYSLGSTVVTLVVTDDRGAADTCQATVTVQDSTPPEITCPAPITRSNTPGQCGAVVTFTVTATDNCTASPVIVSSPASGSFFSVGTTPVTAVATDAALKADTCTFNVTVNDTTQPVIVCPGPITRSNTPGQ
jgi:uncharacterized repeat protein (TIGR01451 family)